MLDRNMAQLKTLTGLDFIDLEIKKKNSILTYFTHLKQIHNDIIIKKVNRGRDCMVRVHKTSNGDYKL